MATRSPIPTVPETDLRPTHARHWVIVFAVALAILSYIDRVCIAQLAPEMSRDLHLSKEQMGAILGVFGISYALLEVPGGFLGDWIGPRKVLIGIVVWWSFFTAATGFAFNRISLLVIRFLFGAGEAGGFPNLTKAFSVWLPLYEKTRAQSILWTFARWGGAFTPPLVILVISHTTWRNAFVFFGSLGLLWVGAFYWWFRDDPANHPSVNRAELELLKASRANVGSHAAVPWGRLFRSRSVWLLWLQYFCLSFPWYFYITWLPTYLQEYFHLSPAVSSRYAILPLFMGGIGCLLCGAITPWFARKVGDLGRARRILACFGFLSASLLLLVVANTPAVLPAMLFMGLASFCNDLIMPCAWSAVMDVGGKYAGTVAGSMNMMGNLAGFFFPWIAGMVVQHMANGWNIMFYIMAAVYIVGFASWPFIDPVTPLEAEPVLALHHA